MNVKFPHQLFVHPLFVSSNKVLLCKPVVFSPPKDTHTNLNYVLLSPQLTKWEYVRQPVCVYEQRQWETVPEHLSPTGCAVHREQQKSLNFFTHATDKAVQRQAPPTALRLTHNETPEQIPLVGNKHNTGIEIILTHTDIATQHCRAGRSWMKCANEGPEYSVWVHEQDSGHTHCSQQQYLTTFTTQSTQCCGQMTNMLVRFSAQVSAGLCNFCF